MQFFTKPKSIIIQFIQGRRRVSANNNKYDKRNQDQRWLTWFNSDQKKM